MSFFVSDFYVGFQRAMAGRTLLQTDMNDWIKATVLELSQSYKFPELQATGPVVPLTFGVAGPYPPNTFLSTPDQGKYIEKVDSFYLYYNTPVFPLTATNGENPGYPLHFQTIDTMEEEINILGIPIHWTRHENQFYFGFAPNQTYYVYMRYKVGNHFSNPPIAGDTIGMPPSWQDIITYACAERAAMELRLFDIADGMHTRLFGDPLFQRSGGTEGKPGLIFSRISQEQQDKTTSFIQMRVMSRSCMRR